jgi:Ca-activated chloride channel homolog
MTLLNPFALILLLLIPTGIIFLMWRNQVRQNALRKVGNDTLVEQLVSQVNSTRRIIKSTLWLVSLSSLIIALTHPIWGVSAEVVQIEGVAVLFIIDISRSMDAQDIAPSRLDRAKIDIERIIQEPEGNDIGFIAFAGEPFVYMPLTYDKYSTQTFLSAITTKATTNQGTNIYPAMTLAVDTLIEHSVAQKFIVLMSDGENHEISNPEGLQLAVDNDIIIHTVGYGTIEGGEIPLYGDEGSIIGYQTDEANVIVTTKLQPTILEEIALQTGGNYYDTDTIDSLANTLQLAETGDLGQRTFTQPTERFGIFLLIALIALSIEILLPENRRQGG